MKPSKKDTKERPGRTTNFVTYNEVELFASLAAAVGKAINEDVRLPVPEVLDIVRHLLQTDSFTFDKIVYLSKSRDLDINQVRTVWQIVERKLCEAGKLKRIPSVYDDFMWQTV